MTLGQNRPSGQYTVFAQLLLSVDKASCHVELQTEGCWFLLASEVIGRRHDTRTAVQLNGVVKLTVPWLSCACKCSARCSMLGHQLLSTLSLKASSIATYLRCWRKNTVLKKKYRILNGISTQLNCFFSSCCYKHPTSSPVNTSVPRFHSVFPTLSVLAYPFCRVIRLHHHQCLQSTGEYPDCCSGGNTPSDWNQPVKSMQQRPFIKSDHSTVDLQ